MPRERVGEEADILRRIRSGESVEHFETVRVRKDGVRIDVSVRISPIRDSSGAIVGASKIARDISERKLREEELRESEERFRLFIEHAPAALAMFDREMRYLHLSRRWRTDYGMGDRDLRGVSHYELFPEVPERWKEIHRRGMAGEVQRADADPFVRIDGVEQWIRWEVRPWRDRTGAIAGIVIFAEDITERKHAQDDLCDSEERLRLALDGARLGTWTWYLKTGALAGSPLAFALFGLPADTKFNFEIFLGTLHPDDRAMVDAAMKRTLAEHVEYDVEYRCIWPDGTEHWIAAKGRAYQDADGEDIRVGGIVFDVTDRRQAEAALRESEQRLLAMANGIPQLAWMAEADGSIFWYNQRWYEYTGTTFEEMEGWAWQRVHDPGNAAESHGTMEGLGRQRRAFRHGISPAGCGRKVPHVPHPRHARQRRGRAGAALVRDEHRHQRTQGSGGTARGPSQDSFPAGRGIGEFPGSARKENPDAETGVGQHGRRPGGGRCRGKISPLERFGEPVAGPQFRRHPSRAFGPRTTLAICPTESRPVPRIAFRWSEPCMGNRSTRNC